jgi:hypothetical protein
MVVRCWCCRFFAKGLRYPVSSAATDYSNRSRLCIGRTNKDIPTEQVISIKELNEFFQPSLDLMFD